MYRRLAKYATHGLSLNTASYTNKNTRPLERPCDVFLVVFLDILLRYLLICI